MCPNKVDNHCNFWLLVGITAIIASVLIGVLFFSGMFNNYIWYIDLSLIVGSVLVSIWSVWVVLVLKHIAKWWIDVNHNINTVVVNLNEICSDLKQLKKELK
jgi:uncharacterized membrane protein